MNLIIIAILTFFSLVSLIIGIFLFLKPALAIDLQIKFYALINWRIKPISMPKEIRNTRIMGLFLVILSIVTAFITICPIRKPF